MANLKSLRNSQNTSTVKLVDMESKMTGLITTHATYNFKLCAVETQLTNLIKLVETRLPKTISALNVHMPSGPQSDDAKKGEKEDQGHRERWISLGVVLVVIVKMMMMMTVRVR